MSRSHGRSRRADRARSGHRTCIDCATVYKVGAGDPRYCPSCVVGHVGRCRDCRTLFDLDGYHRQCPACREQTALFPVIAGHLVTDNSTTTSTGKAGVAVGGGR